jgi:hypothetical protein
MVVVDVDVAGVTAVSFFLHPPIKIAPAANIPAARVRIDFFILFSYLL